MHRSILSGVRAVPTAVAPIACASCTAAVPTPLPHALTSNVSPARSSACVTIASCAVTNASGTAAASSNAMPSGILASARSWLTTYSA